MLTGARRAVARRRSRAQGIDDLPAQPIGGIMGCPTSPAARAKDARTETWQQELARRINSLARIHKTVRHFRASSGIIRVRVWRED